MGNASAIQLHTTLLASEDVVCSQVDDEVVMMSIEKGAYYSLDEIGSRVWALLAEPRTVAEICDALVQEYDVARQQCEQDMLEWLNELAEENLVRIIDAPAE